MDVLRVFIIHNAILWNSFLMALTGLCPGNTTNTFQSESHSSDGALLYSFTNMHYVYAVENCLLYRYT